MRISVSHSCSWRVLLLRRQKLTTVTEANEAIHGHGVDVRVPQSCAGEQSCFLLKLFGDNEVPYSNHYSEYGGSMTRCELNSAELERISINFG
jgi:hypothetical protein